MMYKNQLFTASCMALVTTVIALASRAGSMNDVAKVCSMAAINK